MTYGHFKDLPERTASDKVLRDYVFKIGSNPKYHGYQKALLLWFIIFDNKSASLADTSAAGSNIKIKIKQNKQLPEQLHKPIIHHLKTIFWVLI